MAYPGGRFIVRKRVDCEMGWITIAENLVPEVPLTSICKAFAAQESGETLPKSRHWPSI